MKAIETLAPRVNSNEGVLGFTRLVSPKPTIAAIFGRCVAAGLLLALWCDLRIATEDARFGFPDRKWGVPILDGGTARLAATVGVSRALELVMTGREIDAPEAHRVGLVNEVVANGGHVERSLELAELLAGFPQETLRADRRAIRESLDRALLDSFATDAEVARATADVATQGAGELQRAQPRRHLELIAALPTRLLMSSAITRTRRQACSMASERASSHPLGPWFDQLRSDDRRDRGCSNGSHTGAAWAA